MKNISSPDNPVFKSLKTLLTSKGRKEQGLCIAEGPHLVDEALKANTQLRYVVVSEDTAGEFEAQLNSAEDREAETLVLSGRLFRTLADSQTPQGILAVTETRNMALSELPLSGRISVILDRVQDPGNAGTILRTALAVGAAFAVITADCADPWSPKVVRASQGAVFHLPVAVVENASEAVRFFNSSSWHTACGHLAGEDFFMRQLHERTALVIGNEASGVSQETAEACAARWKLPMPGKAESLNAAVAAGIMLYELWMDEHRI